MKKFLFVTLCVVSFTKINAQSYGTEREDGFYLVTSNDDGDLYYVKTEKASRSPLLNDKIYSAEYWVKIVKASKKIKGKNGKLRTVAGNTELQYFKCSCLDKTYSLEESHEYNSKGKLVKSLIPPISSSAKAIPGSLGEILLNGVCGIIK